MPGRSISTIHPELIALDQTAAHSLNKNAQFPRRFDVSKHKSKPLEFEGFSPVDQVLTDSTNVGFGMSSRLISSCSIGEIAVPTAKNSMT
jgi:hypothetical protein